MIETHEGRRFGTVYKRKDGIWEGKYVHNGNRISIYADSKEIIEAQLSQIKADIEDRIHFEASSMRLSDWLGHWLEIYVKPSVKHPTYLNYRNNINGHVTPALGSVSLKKLDGEQLQRFFNCKALTGRIDGAAGGLSVKTLRNIRNMLNASFQQAIYRHLLATNPLQGVRLPRMDGKKVGALSIIEMKRLFEAALAANKLYGEAIIITLYTGLRIGELLGLQWRNVHLDDESPYIEIKHSLTRMEKPDAHDRNYTIIRQSPGDKTALILGSVKTPKSQRKIYLPKPAADSFVRLQNRLNSENTVSQNENPYDFIFVNRHGNVMDPKSMAAFLDKVAQKANLGHIHFHMLRHTFATRAHESGIETATLADMLGHAQPSTTLNMYTSSTDERRRKACNVLSSLPF